MPVWAERNWPLGRAWQMAERQLAEWQKSAKCIVSLNYGKNRFDYYTEAIPDEHQYHTLLPHHFLTVGQSDRPFQPPVSQVFDDQRSINSSSVIDSGPVR